MHPVAAQELEAARGAIARLRERYGVRRLSLFGSAAGIEFEANRSDDDFIAEFGPWRSEDGPLGQFFGFERALASLLRRPVDVIEEGALAKRSEWFRVGVERTR